MRHWFVSAVSRHWRGDLPLWIAVLAVLAGGQLVVQTLLRAATPLAPSAVSTALAAGSLVVLLWQVTGTVRAVRRYASEHSHSALTLACGLGVVVATWVGTIGAIDLLAVRDLPLRLAAAEPGAVAVDGSTVVLSGTITFAMMNKAAQVLQHDTEVRLVRLNSGGGRIAAARAIAVWVREAGADTEVIETCASACVLIFAAGEVRHLGPDGRLGFHGYAMQAYAPLIDVGAEQDRDIAALIDRGLDEAFLRRAYAVPQSQMWFPTRDELIDAGVIAD